MKEKDGDMATVREIQQALQQAGFDPGPIDGVWGRLCVAAARRFQAANGLVADGVVGPRTLARLFANQPAQAASAPPPVWYAEALRLLGVREVTGRGNNPVIMDWADDLDIHYAGDDVPWCGLFVAHCVGSTLPDEPLPANPLGARQWQSFGERCDPALGAILVFWRESRASFKGHVGFYHGEDGGALQVLGGNQGDSVSVTRIARDRLLDVRKPRSFPALAGGAVVRASSGAVSVNEA